MDYLINYPVNQRLSLSARYRGDILLKRKAIYEELHPGTKQGGDRKSAKIKRQTVPFEKRDKIKGAECPFDNQEPDNIKTI